MNDDSERDVKDLTLLRRVVVGGYIVSVAEEALDVTRDGKVNGKDVTILRRFLVGGYGVEIN